MRILADTNLFYKFARRLPLPGAVESALSDENNEVCVSSISIMEIYRLWQGGKIPTNPDIWLDLALPSWTVFAMTVPIARQSVLWNWGHRDPADRVLAATASVEKVEFWHTDTVLKNLTGFPQKYFKNIVAKPGNQ